MPLQELALRFIVAGLLGALIGTQRELRNWKDKVDDFTFGGIRTYLIIGLFGAVSGYFYLLTGELIVYLVAFVCFALMVLASYIFSVHSSKDRDLLSELVALFVFLLGGMCIFSDYTLPVILGVVITMILSLKPKIHMLLNAITPKDFEDALKFAIVAFVILPLLPNTAVDPWGIVNPFKVWLFVVMISGISFAGFVVSKLVGSGKGILLTGLIGGLASSTATTIHMSHQSKEVKGKTVLFTAGIILASFVMFLRLEFVLVILSMELAISVLKCFIPMFLVAGGVLVYMWIRERKHNGRKVTQSQELKLESSFKLLPAIKFGGFFLCIQLIDFASVHFFGESGIYLFSFIAGIADVDSPTYIIANQFQYEQAYSLKLATQGVVIAVVMNTVAKGVIPFFFGTKKVAYAVAWTFLPMAVIGLLTAFLL